MVIHPAIFPAFGWAPLIPPKPAVRKISPEGDNPTFLKAFNTVMAVPWTIPCGPIYMKLPAVI